MSSNAKLNTARTVRASTGPVMVNRWQGIALRMVVILIGCFYALFPALLVLSSALSSSNSLTGQGLIPREISFVNFNKVISDPQHPFLLWILNSIKVAGISTIIALAMCSFAAYSLSRFRYQGRRTTMLSILIIQVFPNLLMIIALFLLLQQLGNIVPWLGLNTHGGLIMIYSGGALGFNTWLMKGYFDTIPRELDESAMVDGATHLRTFLTIILPLVRPILAVVGVLTFIGTYSDFLIARVVLKTTDQYTFAVGLALFISDQYNQQWGVFAAAVLIGALPILILYLLVQNQVTSGLTSGAVKG
jgi:arabinogalactan oligomer / maltooligosaccharide transport system permease protein